MPDSLSLHDAVEVTRYIEVRYHAPNRVQLASFAAMTEQMETAYFGDEAEQEGVPDLLPHMMAEGDVHMNEKVLILCPAIRKGGDPSIGNSIAGMRADPDQHDGTTSQIGVLSPDRIQVWGARRTRTHLHESLSVFMNALTDRIRLENDLLFPQFGNVILSMR
ncbi:hypothetical protein [Roseovarius sp. D0-M9]|uniref:hypothetical protein n=1 Tax=Roseovarius sp. D0-M9 TaxID=3127117 RepID=UPI00300FF8D5